MNILPKKRWHVRTKDNIARVRRDEAEAADKERKRIEKQDYAENEARLNILRSKAKPTTTSASAKLDTVAATFTSKDGHVDLFSDFQSHIKTTNKEHEKEKKEEQEKYEKQIGYLTYLGQDTNEALKLRSWYEIAPARAEVGESDIVEKDLKNKYQHDPLTLIKTLLPEEKVVNKIKPTCDQQPMMKEIIDVVKEKNKTSKKEKKHKKDKKKHKEKHQRLVEKRSEEVARKKELIDRLRKERLKREARERSRQEELLFPKVQNPKPIEDSRGPQRIVQKYNSQFNPELAKQNMA